jgi:hypothetical protein
MIVRLAAVALAFVIMGGPALTITCQATCAERETAAAPSGNHQQHSCHTATSSKGVAIIGVPHVDGAFHWSVGGRHAGRGFDWIQ